MQQTKNKMLLSAAQKKAPTYNAMMNMRAYLAQETMTTKTQP